MFSSNADAKCVYVTQKEAMAELIKADWHHKFSQQLGKKVVIWTGETATHLNLLSKRNVIISTPAGQFIRAIFEIVLHRGWAQLTHKFCDLFKMVHVQYIIRQLPQISRRIRKDMATLSRSGLW